MSFLGAAFLWAIPLAALPVIIHLLTRRRKQVLRWGAMQFLREAASRRRRLWRWEDWLLMALRTSAVLAMVLALARPLVRSHWFGSAGGRDVIVVLDSSLSTSRVNAGGNGETRNGALFDAMVRRADELLGQLGESDDVRVLLASTAPRWLTEEAAAVNAENAARLKARLHELKPTLASADMPRCLLEAIEAEGGAGSRRVVTVLTDRQAYGWRVGAADAWQAVKQAAEATTPPPAINVVSLGDEADAVANLSVESLSTGRPILAPSEPVTLTAQIRNTGKWPSEPTSVSWRSGEESLGVTALSALQPGEFTTASLVCSFASVGVRPIACRVDRTDELPLDSGDATVVEVVEHVPILVIDESVRPDPIKTETGYLLAALGRPPGGAEEGWRSVFAPKVVDVAGAAAVRLEDYRAVVCTGVARLPDDLLGRLEAFVRQGGGLWWVLGEQSDPSYFNEKLFAAGKGLSPLGVGEPIGDAGDREQAVLINPPSPDHPATRLLADTQRLDADKGRIHRRHPFRADPQAAKVVVLLKSDAGDGLAIENRFGRGRVIVQAVPMNVHWSNMPLCQAFVVMVHEWLWYLAEPTFGQWNIEPGQMLALSLPVKDGQVPASAEVETPAGLTERIVPVTSNERAACRFADTLLPGEYILAVADGRGGRQSWPFHVRRDVRESDLTALSVSGRQALAVGAGARFVDDPLVDTPQGTRTPRVEPVWSLLLAAIVAFMVVELLLAGRMTRRRWVAAKAVTMGDAHMSAPRAAGHARKREKTLAG